MSEQNRTELLQVQDRSYMIGMIQQLEEEWFFIEEDEDQMVLLETLNTKELEIFLEEKWQKAKLAANGKVKGPFGTHVIHEDDCFRMKKPLPYALDQMLLSLSDKTFEEFAKQLNSLGFSIFDCVYSYNQLLFLSRKKRKKGVSFFQFDNEEGICAVQHHFERGTAEGDRFEFTTSFGKRAVLSYSA